MRPKPIPFMKPNLPFPPYPFPMSTPLGQQQQLTDSQNMRYFEQYKKIYYTAFCLQNQMIEFQNMNQDVKNKTNIIQVTSSYNQKHLDEIAKYQPCSKVNNPKPKRFRRTNEMIDRIYKCNYDKCDKSYASQGSLQQHIRLKHQDQPKPYHFHPRSIKKQQMYENLSNEEPDAEQSQRSSDLEGEEKKENK